MNNKMKTLNLIILATVTIGFLFMPSKAQAAQTAGSSASLKGELFNLAQPDKRIQQLESFLKSYDSPLAEQAENFIISADRYGIDWKLVPAITGVESTFGKRIPYQSYNAYGWASGTYFFESWVCFFPNPIALPNPELLFPADDPEPSRVGA